MKKFYLLLSLILISMIVFTYGCKQKTTAVDAEDPNVQSTKDNALADGEFSSVFSFTDAQGNESYSAIEKKGNSIQEIEKKSDLLPDCATVHFDTLTKTLTIDFGTANCFCLDGNYRRGVITAVFSGKWHVVGSSVNISLQNYYVNDMQVQGTKTITLTAAYTWHVVVSNASITTPTGVINWNADRTIQKTKGFDTPVYTFDDEYTISGSSSGTNRKGVNYSVTTVTPLLKRISCRAKDFVSGVLSVTNLDKNVTLIINFNPGNTVPEPCDKAADVTVNGKTYHIYLR